MPEQEPQPTAWHERDMRVDTSSGGAEITVRAVHLPTATAVTVSGPADQGASRLRSRAIEQLRVKVIGAMQRPDGQDGPE
jgi:hypothetical protein